MSKRRRRILDILEILQSHPHPLNSAEIADYLRDEGDDISDRTIRHYLGIMDAEGLTENTGRRGRVLTEKGRASAGEHTTIDKVGFLSAKIDQMTYAMTFDPTACRGTVVVNSVAVKPADMKACLDQVELVFKYGYAMGTLAALHTPDESPSEIPADCVGLTTVCSVTLNGVLLKHGIPSHSRFGGVLEIEDGKAKGFSAIINYDGTTIDPLEVFIRSGMTNYMGAISTGTGRIGASFREIPGDSRDLAMELSHNLDDIGLGGIFEIARRSRPLLGVPVAAGRAGMILIGGLNPASIFTEKGIRVHARALSGLMEYEELSHYSNLRKKLKQLL